MPKLKYQGLVDGVTSKAIQIWHQEALYFQLLMPAIDLLAENDLVPEQKPILLDFSSMMVGWAKEELCVLGFVSVFHMWERQIGELLIEQKSIQELAIPTRKKRESVVVYARRIIEDYFEIPGLDSYWDELSRALAVVNAFKHGQGVKFYTAMEKYPEYFYVPTEPERLPMVSVNRNQLSQLIRSLQNFWEALPVELQYHI